MISNASADKNAANNAVALTKGFARNKIVNIF